MTTILIPTWLKKRPIFNSDTIQLKSLFSDIAGKTFKDIGINELKGFYNKNPREVFYKSIRILGFYGVVFYGKLTTYSGPDEAYPEIIKINPSFMGSRVINFLEDSELLSVFVSCGIDKVCQLNGVPVASIKGLLKSTINIDLFLANLPIEISCATDEFFSNSYLIEQDNLPEAAEILAKYHVLNKSENDDPVNSIEALDLSVRSRNCLSNAGVKSISALSYMSDEELLSIKHFGRKCLREIRGKLSELPTNSVISNKQRHREPSPELDINSSEILKKLKTRISDLVLSVRSRRCLEKNNIEFIWQLTQFTERDLHKMRNLGRKSISELRRCISDKGFELGMRFTPEQLAIIKSYAVSDNPSSSEERLKTLLSALTNTPLIFLNDRENQIVARRLLKVGRKDTLEAIASESNVSRERIRQIERSAVDKIRRQYTRDLRTIKNEINTKVDGFGGLADTQNLHIKLDDLSKEVQTIISFLLSIMDEKYVVDWKYGLVTSKGQEWLSSIFDKIQEGILEICSGKFFTESDVVEVTNQVLNSMSITNFSGRESLIARFKEEKKVNKLEESLCFGRVTKQDKIAQVFKELFPEGLHIYKKRKILITRLVEFSQDVFGGVSARSILARLTNNTDILLWGRGFFIHKDHVLYDELLIDKIIQWIKEQFNQGHSRFQVDVPFNTFRNGLLDGGVPNSYALYTLIRLQDNERIGQRKYPTIVDLEADVDLNEGILEELERFFFEAQKPVPYSDLKKEFIGKRGWKKYSLGQNIGAHSDSIYPWHYKKYIHIEYMDVNYEKLDQLIDSLRAKLNEIQTAYSLKGAKKLMGVLWEEVCPGASVRTMIKLIRSVDPEDLETVGYFVQFADNFTDSFSITAELEEYFLEKGMELSSYDLREEFCTQRGWSEMQLYGAVRKARLFRTGKSSFLHPSTIDWSDNLSQSVHKILETNLAGRNKNDSPHMQIEELIYKYVLPELPHEIQWTRHLLKSVGEAYGDFLFFADSYIAVDNDFNIEDLDDMIGYLIGRDFPLGIAKKNEVEQMLWREGIIESGKSIPSDQFFDESSILFLPESDEVGLSSIGYKRYGQAK